MVLSEHRRALLALALCMLAPSPLRAFDLHAFWDNRCSECHGHAADFARTHLNVADGRLQGRHHTSDLQKFLTQHEMGPTHADGIYRMLLAQVQTQPVYQQKCAGCHDTAAEFARKSLVLKDGVAVGSGNGLPVADFLKKHGRVTPTEAQTVTESLTRLLKETGATPTTK